MNKLKRFSAVFTATLLCAAALSGCDEKEDSPADVSVTEQVVSEQESSSDTSEEETVEKNQTESEYFSNRQLDDNIDNPDAEIILKGSSAEIKGNGAEFSDKKVSITQGGTYLLSGTLDDGQIYVNTSDKVHIALNGVTISCSDSSPFYIEDSDNAVITVCGNTENTLSDGTAYNTDENGPDAVIYSKDDLALNGSGTLNINANFNEGITSKNDLRISDVTLNIKSAGNAVKGKDSLAFREAVITVNSQADGLKSSNSEEDGKGYIAIESGKFDITSAEDAIQAETDLIINDGNFSIKTGNSSDNTAGTDMETQPQFDHGMPRMEGNQNKTVDSEKGLKAGKNLVINGGNITADCADDTIHSSETVKICGGTLNLSSGDDGIHADAQLDIDGGEISILKSYEGLEAAVINVNDGSIHVTSDDDGFNASEGSSGNNFSISAGRMGGFGDVSENCVLNINGGYIYVNAGGDGLDSNGSMNMNGGTAIVDGPVNDDNGALDSGTEINMNGGVLIAAGSSGMAETPSDSSSQASIAIAMNESQSEKTMICVLDENEKPVIAYSPSKTFSSVIVSTPDIVKGRSYSIYSGGSYSGNEKDGLYSDGEYIKGTLIEKITADSTVTNAGTGTLGSMGRGHGGRGGFTPPDGEMPDREMPDGMPPERPDNIPEGTPPDKAPGGMTPPERFSNGMMPPDGNMEQ